MIHEFTVYALMWDEDGKKYDDATPPALGSVHIVPIGGPFDGFAVRPLRSGGSARLNFPLGRTAPETLAECPEAIWRVLEGLAVRLKLSPQNWSATFTVHYDTDADVAEIVFHANTRKDLHNV